MSEQKPKALLNWQDTEQAQRGLLEWLNTYPELPAEISFESLPEDTVGLCVSTIQTAYKLRQYITGGYLAQYQFNLIYRIQPSTDRDRLGAVELLNRVGGWAEQAGTRPQVAQGLYAREVSRNNSAALLAVYEDGTADYQIAMTMTWEVM